MSSDLVLTKGSAPLNPPAGTVSLYSKTDGKFYHKDESGTETLLVDQSSLGTAAFENTTAFDVAGAAAAAQAASDPVGSASAVLATSLQKTSNLSDLANAATARTNLGLGSSATHASTDYDAAGAAAAAQVAAIAASDPVGSASAVLATSLQKASNLSDLASAATARTNLGLGTAATQSSGAFDAAGAATAAQAAAIAVSAQRASNLSDLASAATARTNLGLGTAATQASSAFDAAGAASAAQAAAIAASDPVGTAASTMSAHNAAADPHTGYLKADGTRALTSDMALGSHKFTGATQAASAGQFVEYAQWQASLAGVHWITAVSDPGLITDALSTPPGSASAEQTYLIGASPTGAWAGLAGHLVYYNGTAWVDVLGRAIIVGDRLGIAFEGGTVAGSFTSKANQIATVTNATPGSYAYTFYIPTAADATWSNAAFGEHRGDIYNYDGSAWVETPGPKDFLPGAALAVTGSTWNVQTDNTTIHVDGTNKLAVVTGVFDAAGSATAAQAAAIAASAQRASNLSDLANAATARTNLGLGTAATQASTAFDAAGAASAAQAAAIAASDPVGSATAAQAAAIAASAQRASNLSDLANVATARTNLGLGTAATQASTAFDAAGAAAAVLATSAQKANNLSDLASAATARTNLGLGTAATQASTAFDASGAAASAQAFAIQRVNHTGTQLASTISDFSSSALATALTGLAAGSNVSILSTDSILAALAKLQAEIDATNTAASVWNELISVTQLNSTSNVTLTNITELAQSCVIGGNYHFEATLLFRSANINTSVALCLGTSDTAAGSLAGTIRILQATAGTAANFEGSIVALGGLVTSTISLAANTTYIATITGMFSCTTAGTLVPQFRSSRNGTQVSIMANSVMLMRKF